MRELREHAKIYADLVAIGIEHAQMQLGNVGDRDCSPDEPRYLRVVRQKLPQLFKLRDLFLKISETRFISWKDNKTCGKGIARILRDEFPLPLKASDEDVGSPMSVGRSYRIAREFAVCDDDQAAETLYQYLMDFCFGLANVMHRIERNRTLSADEEPIQASDNADKAAKQRDYTYEFRKELNVKRLCQFCWRPARNGRGETCCNQHSQLKNPAGYMYSKRHNLQTPEIVRIAFDHGTMKILSPSIKAFEAWPAHGLRSMRDDWNTAIADGVAQKFVDSLQGLAYKRLKSAQEHKNWDCFFSHLCDAFKVGPYDMPDDPDYLALVLPHAIAEVEAQRNREAGKRKPVGKEQVIRLALNISKTGRGWQTRLAEQTGLSRQRIHAILKEVRFAERVVGQP